MPDWYIFSPIDCFPHCGCEQAPMDFFIRQPWAVLSSLGYFLVGFIILMRARRDGVSHKGWPFLLCLIGTTSILAHSNYTKLSMAMDFTSIVFLITYFPMGDILELRAFKRIPIWLTFPLYYVMLVAFLMPFTMLQQYYIAMVMFFFSMFHLIKEKGWGLFWDRKLLTALLTIGFSLIFMFVDKNEYFCSLKFVPYGHTLWHIGSTVGIYLFGKWYFFESGMEAKSSRS